MLDGYSSSTGQATLQLITLMGVTLNYNGKIRDRVGQGDSALSPDSFLDGVFTVTLPVGSGSRTVTSLDLRNSSGGVWDTLPNGFWALGAASNLDGALLNASDATVNFAVGDGGSFNIFASDSGGSMFNSGVIFTLTVNFSDGTIGVGNLTPP